MTENSPKCLGTIITARHILSAATCFCNPDLPQYNLEWGSNGCESVNGETKRIQNEQKTKGLLAYKHVKISLKYQDPLGRNSPIKFLDVLWVSIHHSFRKSTRENNIAILGTVYPMQFHAHFYPICLPSASFSDTNADPFGILKYSIKLLSTEGDTGKSFTNANGRTIYGECATNCTSQNPLENIYDDKETEKL